MGDVKDKGKKRWLEGALNSSILQNLRLDLSPFVIIAVTTLITIAISIYFLSSGYFNIFQNLFYIPIIIACMYYKKRGFIFSVIVACIYFLLTLVFTRESSMLLEAFVMVLIFVLVAGIVSYLSSARKRAGEALQQSEERFRQMVDLLPEAVCEFDTSGNILFGNSAAFIMVGYDEADFDKGLNILPMIAPEDQKRAYTNIQKMMAGEALGADEYTLVRKDGSRFPTTVHIANIFNASGKTIGFRGIIVDITERRQAAEAQQRLAAIVESSHDAIIGKTLDGIITSWNKGAEERYGYSAAEVVGHSISIIVPPDRAEEVPQFLAKIGRGEAVIDYETVRVAKDGRRITALLTISPIKDVSGKIVGASTIAQDITERKRMEVALRERLKELDCLYGISAVLEVPGISLDEILKRVAMLIPPAWQFPDITEACIVLEGLLFQTPRFRETLWMQSSEMIVNGKPVGQVKVCYLEKRQESDEGPFIIEERYLLDAIAERLGRVVERVWAEEALRESEARIRLLLDSAAEAIYGIDMNGNCTFCNSACLRMLGYRRPDELLGKNMHWQIHSKRPDGTQFPIAECRIFQAFRNGKGTHVDDEVLWRSDDTSFAAEYWSYPLFRDGVIAGAVVTFLDITERKRFEEMLKESEQKFRELADLLPQTVCEIDLNGHFTYANRYGIEAHGYTKEEIEKSLNAIDLFIPAERDRVVQNISRVLAGQPFDDHEYNVLHKDGSTYPAIIYTNSIVRDGQIVGVRALVVDITERKKIEQMKTDFVSFISHQLRTPVAGLMAYIDNMLDGITGALNDMQVDYLREMHDVCARNNRLIADLLNVSRLERGILAVNINPVDLRSVVDSAVKEHRKVIEEKGLFLNIEEADQGIVVLADTDKLVEV